jgi:hypothetical protein
MALEGVEETCVILFFATEVSTVGWAYDAFTPTVAFGVAFSMLGAVLADS